MLRIYYWQGLNIKNIGDELGPFIIKNFTKKKVVKTSHKDRGALFTVGSILGMAKYAGQTVWGAGFMTSHQNSNLKSNIFTVRGPLSRIKIKSRPLPVGDPALLLPRVYQPQAKKKYKLGIIPHYVDRDFLNRNFIIDINSPLKIINVLTDDVINFIKEVNECEYVISSSLHGLIVAQAYQIPALWVEFSDKVVGSGFKFFDYFLSVGIPPYRPIRINSHECRASYLLKILSHRRYTLEIVNFDESGLVQTLEDSVLCAEKNQEIFKR